uniref:NADPH:adrenodoxin oxidoreductase, mitochondrial n=1 Tax=Ciona savignyi TaxID=51511 RepID=H2Y8I4_CIOSA
TYAQRRFQSSNTNPQICIVGSGPAGFGVAQFILKNHPSAQVDMFEKLPVPFGLIRYGVSPDHQDVKNCINGYTKTASSNRFSFHGNVDVGKDVTLVQLCSNYHAVVLCHGAQEERRLGINGQDSRNVFTSSQFVGWYNGNPSYQNVDIDLSGNTAVIIGVGNVALDCARMLLKPTKMLEDTDITSSACNKLSTSNINRVHLVGRRGPMQMACTRKELSEITDLEGISKKLNYIFICNNCLTDLKRRKQQRLIKYLKKVAKVSPLSNSEKQLFVEYLLTPHSVMSDDDGSVTGGDNVYDPDIIPTDETHHIPCQLVLSCIGNDNKPLDSRLVPFSSGKIDHIGGRVNAELGLYASGWCRDGAQGVLADSSNSSMETAATVLGDIEDLMQRKSNCNGHNSVFNFLNEKDIVSWKGWTTIDQHEINQGKKLGKIREKVLSVNELIEISKT